MDPIKLRQSPERKIQDAIIKFLTDRGWFVMETHGNMYQRGLPDLYATHIKHGPRWIEVKNGDSYSFTPAQLQYFPKLTKNGAGVWIMVAASESEYKKLFSGCNWYWYLHLLNTRGVTSVPQKPLDFFKGAL